MNRKVWKGSVWLDKDSRAKGRMVIVIGFENTGGGRRARIRRVFSDGMTLDPASRITTIDPNNLLTRFERVDIAKASTPIATLDNDFMGPEL